MRKILLGMFFMAFAALVSAQSQRMVFMEEFTQASCPPCEQTTPALNAMVEANADKIVQIRYQTSWPGVDPMNANNPGDVQARVDYYGVTGVPTVLVDGTAQPVSGELTQEAVDNSYNNSAPISVSVTHSLSDDLYSMDVTVSITNEGSEPYMLSGNKLRVASVEEVINFDSPPGSTSLVDFEAVMKEFLTGVEGMDIPSIAAGETYEMTWNDYAVRQTIYNAEKIAVVAWVQNDDTRSVANAGISHPQDLPGNYASMSITNVDTQTEDLCDLGFIPQVEVTNNGSDAISDYSVNLFVNGVLTQTIDNPAELVSSASSTISFDEMELNGGASFISYSVLPAIGDLSTVNNSTPTTIESRASNPSSEDISLTFEDQIPGIFPLFGVVDVPFTSFNFTVVTGLGAYGNSNQCIGVNFYQWNPADFDATGSMTITDQYTVPSGGAILSFDHAFTTWGGSTDKLEVQVSTDCGSTFTTIWEKQGSDLATAPEFNQNDARFIPADDQWATNEIDLNAYEGQDVLVRLFVTSSWGDMLWMDNFAFMTPVGTTELLENESLSIYPNPANDVVNIDLVTNSQVYVQVIDQLGRSLINKSIGEVSGELSHNIDVSSLSTGVYMMKIMLDDRQLTKQFMKL